MEISTSFTFLKCTLDDVRIMGIDKLGKLVTCIDAAYGTHPDFRIYTGGVVSLGRGALINKSVKQKLNTKSSCEAEVVGVSDVFPANIWLTNFLHAQGYKVHDNVLYQDNTSAIKMHKNGWMSCSKKSRHIAITYFFIKDRHDKGEFTIKHCPTTLMLADYHSKSLQGKLFRDFRSVIMGHKTIDWLMNRVPSIKERVENDILIDVTKGKKG